MERLEKWVQHFKEEAIRFGTNSANGKDYAEIAVILDKYEQIQKSIGGDYDLDRLRELVEAYRDGRCVVLPSGGYTDKDGENALKSAMNTCFYHNNPVTRYIADAVAEKLTREAEEDALVKECANKAESTLGKQLREFYSEELIDAVLKGDK